VVFSPAESRRYVGVRGWPGTAHKENLSQLNPLAIRSEPEQTNAPEGGGTTQSGNPAPGPMRCGTTASGDERIAPMSDASGASEEVELVQLLTPEGERLEHPEYSFSGDDDQIKGFYRDMVLTRRIDAEATALQRQGELGLWASCLGQEAAQVGSGRALGKQDFVFPTYREHGVALCLGVDPLHLLGLFRGIDLGGWDSQKYRFHLYTIVIGAQTLHATGYAMAVERDGLVGTGDPDRDMAVIGYFGDGASSEGDVNEAFIFASSYNAPIVFFCQNNQWAISEPIERQSRIPLYRRASGFGFPGVRVDGNDVLAVYAATTAALERARTGNGPTLIEAYTYRMGAHTTSDDPTKYRLADELEHWRLKDPIERVRAYLTRSGSGEEAFFADVETEASDLAAELRAGCLALPDPRILDLFDHVYAEQTPYLIEQKERYAEYVASFEDVSQEAGLRQAQPDGQPQPAFPGGVH
jgi:2-oxoisovalerate dehydrogenase E1 component alpha subunit